MANTFWWFASAVRSLTFNPDSSFPRDVEVWDTKGKLVYKLASLPLADQVPIDGVITGPRSYRWRPTEPATLVWVEALDGGDQKRKCHTVIGY